MKQPQLTFKITPLRPINEVLQEALSQHPPRPTGTYLPSDLVDLARLDSGFMFDIRYATDNNFVGTPLYSQAKAFLERPAALALCRVNKRLHEEGYGLIVYDGYRPWYVTWLFWQVTPDEEKIFLADPQEGSKHNRGSAIDVGMYSLATKEELEFPSGFDEMTERAFSDYAGGTPEQNHHRKVLREAMESEGFIVHPKEWWHFDYHDWNLYEIQNIRFEEIKG